MLKESLKSTRNNENDEIAFVSDCRVAASKKKEGAASDLSAAMCFRTAVCTVVKSRSPGPPEAMTFKEANEIID